MAKKINARQYSDDFLRLYQEGHSIRAIAKKYELSKGTVGRVLKERQEIRQFPAEQQDIKDEVYMLYQRGWNRNQIATELGLSHSSVTKILVRDYKADLQINRQYGHLAEAFRKAYEEGMSLRDIAVKYEVSAQTVLTYLNIDGENARSLSEAGRIYDIDESYFNELTKSNVHQLGLLYAIGHLVRAHNSDVIRLSVRLSQEALLWETFNGITEQCEERITRNKVNDISILQLSSSSLFQTLTQLGFPNRVPSIPSEYLLVFWNGFFKANATFASGRASLTFETRSPELREELLTYLKEVHRIEPWYFRLLSKSGVFCEHNEAMIPLIQLFPALRDKLPHKTTSRNWEYFYEKYAFLGERVK